MELSTKPKEYLKNNTITEIDNLKWVDFLKIMKTEKPQLLDKNYSESKKYGKSEIQYYTQVWVGLKDEAFKLESEDVKNLLRKSRDKFLLQSTIVIFQKDYALLRNIAIDMDIYRQAEKMQDFDRNIQELYSAVKNHEKQTLGTNRIKIQYFDKIEVNLKIIERVIASLVNEFNTKHKDLEKKIEKEELSIYGEALKVSRILGITVDVNTIVVPAWIEAKKEARAEVKRQNDQNQKNQRKNV